MLTDVMCTAEVPNSQLEYSKCFSARALREMLCFACPFKSNLGLYENSLQLLSDAIGANVSFATFRLEEQPLPWAPADVWWLVLWLIPVWIILLVPAVLVARWVLKPRDSVRKELAAALDRVEVEDLRKTVNEPKVRLLIWGMGDSGRVCWWRGGFSSRGTASEKNWRRRWIELKWRICQRHSTSQGCVFIWGVDGVGGGVGAEG
jgi:hypothetical protein